MTDFSTAMRQEQEQSDRTEVLNALRTLLAKVEALEKQVAALKKPAKGE